MTYRWRGRSSNEFLAAIIFAGFLAGFIFYLCLGNYQRAKRAMDRQRKRRQELEEEKRALTLSPSGAGTIGSGTRRRINFSGGGGGGNGDAYDSPRSGYSGTSSMYTDEKGLTVGVGGITVEGNRTHMILGGDQTSSQQPIDLLDNSGHGGGGINGYGTIIQQTPGDGEMSV